MPFLAVRNLRKHYGKIAALTDVSLTVERGEFVCFLGPSGCGKTTLLRAIAGLDPQSDGRIELDGVDISRDPPEKRGFGIVFQSYALFPNLTVLDNVAYGLVSRKLARVERDRRTREWLDRVGLSGFESKFPGQCSGGQQQRVALARALAPQPSLLLLDEPLSALDAQVRVHLRTELKQLQESLGVTTIMVTHDQEEALTLADRVVVMNHGVVEQIGAPHDVYLRPASRFVAQFVGAMNFVAADVIDASTLKLGGIDVRLPSPCDRSPGEHVVAAIRPEHLRLAQDGLPAKITAREFLGSQLRIWLQLGTGEEAQLLLAADAAHAVPVDGSSVRLGVAPEHVRVYA